MKEKISDKQFLLIINGPSCGGKSSVVKVMMERYAGLYLGKYDAIKRLISDYTAGAYEEVVYEMVWATMRVALHRGFSVVKEGSLLATEKLLEHAEESGVPLFVANIEAPEEVLLRRFKERVEESKDNPDIPISNTSLDRFKELQKKYFNVKMDSPLEFDSSTETPEEIVDQIVEHLRENL
jgi:predicted kinase